MARASVSQSRRSGVETPGRLSASFVLGFGAEVPTAAVAVA